MLKEKMASLSAKSKKGTVIHRTTSETLRLGDEIRVTGSRKKSQATSPSCSFQITGVLTRYDLEDESADDLDESHTDEISRVTDNETPSFSEDSRDDQQQVLPPKCPSPPNKEPAVDTNVEPISRGRWTCYDYVDESSISRPYWASNQRDYLYPGGLVMPQPIPIYVPMSTERPIPISSQYALPKSRVSFASCTSVDTIINNADLDTNQNKQSLANNFNNISHHEQEGPTNSNDNNRASVPCTATIDTKIEHALDVVKNHLTHAVRLEVDELKIKINELVERISFLEYENDLLRANASPDVLANLKNSGRN